MGPGAVAEGADAPGLIHELVPGFAAMGDDVVVAAEDPVREPVVAEELPDVFDRVELGRPRRQRQERDVGGHDELVREMPARLIEQEDGMGVRRDRRADLDEMRLHRLRVAPGHDQPGALALGRADRPEDIGPRGPLVVRRARARAAPRPAAGDLVLLADARLVLEPDLYRLAARRGPGDLRQAGGGAEDWLRNSPDPT